MEYYTNNMKSLYIIICLANVFDMLYGNRKITAIDVKRESAYEFLKAIADISNWSDEEKDGYKMLVEIMKRGPKNIKNVDGLLLYFCTLYDAILKVDTEG